MNSIAHIYLLLGPEIGQKTEFINRLRREIHSVDPGVEQYKFYPYDSKMSEIIIILQTPGLFQAKRFVHLSNIEDFDSSQMDQLIRALSNLSEDVWVVMTSNLTQTAKIHRKIESVVPEKNKHIFWEMFENRKHEWIQNFFQKENLRITTEALERLLSLVENNTQELGVACDALAGYFRQKDIIDEEDVNRFIVHSREETVYTLFSHIVRSDLSGACESLNTLALSTEGVGVQTLSRLLWQFRRLLRFKELTEGGMSPDTAARQTMILGRHQINLYQSAARKFSGEFLRNTLMRFSEYDALLRSNYPKNMQKIIIESFLVSLCAFA